MNNVFEDEIYQKGLEIYNSGYVSAIKQRDNLFAAQIKGNAKYRPYILVSNNKIKKTGCSCNKDKCQHVASLYIKLKKERHMFIDKTFKGYYEIQDYQAMIASLSQELNQIIEKSEYANIKQTFLLLGKYLEDYNHMILPTDILNKVDDIFDDLYRELLKDKAYASYYSLWLEDILTHDWLPSLSHLLCRITNHLPVKDIKKIYFAYLEYHRNQKLVNEMIHSLIVKNIKITKKEYQTILKYIDSHSIDAIYLQIQEYISNNDIEHAKDLFLEYEIKLKKVFDMEYIEAMVYINSNNPYDYQKYVIEFYRQKDHRHDIRPLKRLINLYGDQWQDAQFKVLDELSQMMNKESMRLLLLQIDCSLYQINLFLENHIARYDEYYVDYEKIIKKASLQMYIYYLEDYYSESAFYCYNYSWVVGNLKHKFQGIDSKEIKEEFVYDMIQKRPNDEEFHCALLEFLEEVEA